MQAGDSRLTRILAVACLAGGLIIGFFLGRLDTSGPDPAPDHAGSGFVGRASSPAPEKLSSGATQAPTTRAVLADVADDRAQPLSDLRSRAEAAKESGNPLRYIAELAPLILALSEE